MCTSAIRRQRRHNLGLCGVHKNWLLPRFLFFNREAHKTRATALNENQEAFWRIKIQQGCPEETCVKNSSTIYMIFPKCFDFFTFLCWLRNISDGLYLLCWKIGSLWKILYTNTKFERTFLGFDIYENGLWRILTHFWHPIPLRRKIEEKFRSCRVIMVSK